MTAEALLEVRDLKKYFAVGRATVRAVDGVSLRIGRGETFGLVGESGCGKSTLGRTILRLQEPTGGAVEFEGKDLVKVSSRQLNRLRPRLQIVFQDPAASLNPVMSVGVNIQEALTIHHVGTARERRAQVDKLLDEVGIGRQFYNAFPHELSIGQQQRVAIARAVALKPAFIVCDEPVSALDLSVQGQILKLLVDLQQEYGLAYLFISHDLRVVQYLSHRIGVMYLGRLVEEGPTEEVYREPAHPYTRALLSAVPQLDQTEEGTRQRIILSGELPSPLNPPPGCPFHPRCPYKMEICSRVFPETTVLSAGHQVNCHLYPAKGGSPFNQVEPSRDVPHQPPV
jgi:oligopeptide/dipeptide ABC transporter ATP-binding protein